MASQGRPATAQKTTTAAGSVVCLGFADRLHRLYRRGFSFCCAHAQKRGHAARQADTDDGHNDQFDHPEPGILNSPSWCTSEKGVLPLIVLSAVPGHPPSNQIGTLAQGVYQIGELQARSLTTGRSGIDASRASAR